MLSTTPERRNAPLPRQRRRADEVRRVSDLLRQDLAELSAETGVLPDERLLALQFGASRNAVREALTLLRDEGFVERRQGCGTRVIAPQPLVGRASSGLVNDVADGPARVQYRPLWHEEVPATGTVARQLGLAPGDPVVLLERLTSVDGVPTCLWTTYLRREDGLAVAATACSGDGLELIERALGVEIGQVALQTEAVLADESVTDLLAVRPGQPLLRLSRLLFDATGRPVALGFGRAPGSRMAIVSSTSRPSRGERGATPAPGLFG